MTDRVSGFTVILNEGIRIDDADGIMQAIKHIIGVAQVEPIIEVPDTHIGAIREKGRVLRELSDFIHQQMKK